uniref:RNA-binding protein 4 n=1 Tax=Parascaris univalens TaxID=6257 RepID=A0A915BF08_PARUN
MVKLFVGGLPDGVDSIRLRQLFSQFVIVNECDVIKDYAFVHVADEESARIAIEKLDGYILENKPINIRRSTSKLRREPGLDKRCYRCGAAEHKTMQCPSDPSNQAGALKRVASTGQPISTIGTPEQKRFAADPTGTGTPTITINLTGRPGEGTATQLQQGAYIYQALQPQQVAAVALTAAESDPELPRPTDGDLFPLYEQYMESRTKYFYFRERLSKEVKARAHSMPAVTASSLQAPYMTTLYGVQTTHQYAQQTASPAYSTGAHYYANATASPTTYSTAQPIVYSTAVTQQPTVTNVYQTTALAQPARLY